MTSAISSPILRPLETNAGPSDPGRTLCPADLPIRYRTNPTAQVPSWSESTEDSHNNSIPLTAHLCPAGFCDEDHRDWAIDRPAPVRENADDEGSGATALPSSPHLPLPERSPMRGKNDECTTPQLPLFGRIGRRSGPARCGMQIAPARAGAGTHAMRRFSPQASLGSVSGAAGDVADRDRVVGDLVQDPVPAHSQPA
jgi:hypothetical protein